MGSDKTVAAAFTANASGHPPNTKISKAKINQSNDSAKFAFTAAGESNAKATSGFQCALVKKKRAKPKFKKCASPKKYKHLKPGKHKFRVAATDQADNTDPTPAKFKFKVLER